MKRISAISIAGLSGILTASAISTTRYQEYLDGFFDRGITLSLFTLGFGLIHFLLLPFAWDRFMGAPRKIRYWAASLMIASAISFVSNYTLLVVIAMIPAAFVLVSSGIPALQELARQRRALRFIVAHAFGVLTSLFLLWLFQIFSASLWEFVIAIVLLNLVFTPAVDILLEQAGRSLRSNPKDKVVPFAVLGLGFLLVLLSIRFFLQYPRLFPLESFASDPARIAVFFCLSILSQSWAGLFLQKLEGAGLRVSPLVKRIRPNLPGLLLAASIFISTYLMATALVSESFGLIDNYFDTDSPLWVNYLTADVDQVVELRAVHPFVLLILRPPVWLISVLLPVDKFHAAILLNSLTGGAAAFLAWLFFKQRMGNTGYALLIAALLGFSNSHLILGIFLESYIFSAAMLLTFVVLLQVRRDSKLSHLVPIGLLTFGITITNFVQTCIAFLLVRRDMKALIKYVVIVLALAVLLSFVHTLLYPLSDPFYIPGKLAGEGAYQYDLLNAPPGLALERATALTRNILLVSMIAPDPLILLEELGCALPCFNTMLDFGDRFQIAPYSGIGSWLARFWFLLLIIAGGVFLWRLIQSPGEAAMQAALAINLAFNFILHMNYGDDPMLYSPNWTYALVLFFGISFEKFGDNKWLQVVLLAFAAALLFNNLELIGKVLEAIAPFFPITP